MTSLLYPSDRQSKNRSEQEEIMGKKIRVIIALVVIIGVVYWAINTTRERSYSGSKFTFRVGSGSVVVNNRGQAPIPVEMRAEGRTASFRVDSAEFGLNESSKTQRSGRTTYHAVNFDLPPGQSKINVARGSNVYFVSASDQRIDAVVTPMRIDSARTLFVWAGVIILAALYYISRTLEHGWIGALRRKIPKQILRFRRPAT
jgi:hypothetical protein